MSRAKLRAIILVIGLALVPRVGAQAQDIPASFIIEAMPVDETANTAAEARDRALIRAQSMAFARLVARARELGLLPLDTLSPA